MGYFDNLSRAVNLDQPVPAPQEPKAVPAQPCVQPATVTAAPPAAEEVEAIPSAAEPVPAQVQEATTPKPLSLETPAPEPGDDARQAHEAAEAKRKAEWEAKQREKKAAEQVRLDRIAAMSDEEAMAAARQRVSSDTEKLTRRNMKDCVGQHVQELCRQDPDFARKAMHPRKSMVHCFRFINRKAKEFIKAEMEANGIQPESGVYGDDVPDDLVYQWAVDYFNDLDAKEDQEKEEKFVPRPYMGKSSSKVESKPKKEPVKPKAVKPKPQADVDGQLSLMGAMV